MGSEVFLGSIDTPTLVPTQGCQVVAELDLYSKKDDSIRLRAWHLMLSTPIAVSQSNVTEVVAFPRFMEIRLSESSFRPVPVVLCTIINLEKIESGRATIDDLRMVIWADVSQTRSALP